MGECTPACGRRLPLAPPYSSPSSPSWLLFSHRGLSLLFFERNKRERSVRVGRGCCCGCSLHDADEERLALLVFLHEDTAATGEPVDAVAAANVAADTTGEALADAGAARITRARASSSVCCLHGRASIPPVACMLLLRTCWTCDCCCCARLPACCYCAWEDNSNNNPKSHKENPREMGVSNLSIFSNVQGTSDSKKQSKTCTHKQALVEMALVVFVCVCVACAQHTCRSCCC